METKANYTIVGIFTLIVVAAAFGFVYWMAEFGRGGPTAQLTIRIPGSANGLSVGSPVRFNGIPVGTVRGLSIDRDDPAYSIAYTEVQADAPVFPSTRAVLEIQGLTGAAYIELSGGRSNEERILQKSFETGVPAELTADLSSVTNLLATADKILKRADGAIGELQGFVQDARGPLTETVRNAEKFSAALASNSDGIENFLESLSSLSTTVQSVSVRLDGTLTAVEDLVKAVDSQKIDSILTNVDKVTSDVAASSGGIQDVMDTVQRTSRNFEQASAEVQTVVKRADELLASVDAAKVSNTVDDVSAATADARQAISTFRQIADDVGTRRQDIDQAIADFTDMSRKLNLASSRVDGILAKVDGMLGTDDANSLFAKARETLASFKAVADNLNARIGPIADNLTRFSNSGLRDFQALINNTRQTVDNLNNTITNFDRDPQRLIFGGENVKQYDGRTRR
ncbi:MULTISPECIES: MlaD family protein [Agrobacterium]|uniref:Phospholipid/cholesterol/gamma-HCH transport system substrate-binding protein n=1 Tax=Agrobacterium larrymoorei TaxID=160699 RepID=A0AAJ2BA78_9HYPH|nr:MlaD family protein [Agrobacterium larrymoorei]MDQ1198692.1 phospholipid/cholesterol/gamma-HCH transport system substrate-binding protein [Rhizobium sp. SORGH_AS_0787]MDR6102481.1 phospholipid/cholesterol/gamma-HCH transport system substrate-binding protein [Agrobacterium larrymoorei]